MQIIKVKFLKDGQPSGRAYTYFSNEAVAVDDIVQINESAKGVVEQIDVDESEIEAFKDKVKTIVGKVVEESNRVVLKDWSLYASNDNGFTPPELLHMHLQGDAYGHSRFKDGDPINSSRIVDIKDCGTHKEAVTYSGSVYELHKEDVNPECEKQFPNYYERLSLKKVEEN